MEVWLEIFFTRIAAGQVLYLKCCENISRETACPDRMVHAALLREFPGQVSSDINLLVHSTSWRYEEPSRVVLTYLVYSDSLNLLDSRACDIPLAEFEIACNDKPGLPHPEIVCESAVLSHGYRHLSFLAASNPAIREALTAHPEAIEVLERLNIALAGNLLHHSLYDTGQDTEQQAQQYPAVLENGRVPANPPELILPPGEQSITSRQAYQ